MEAERGICLPIAITYRERDGPEPLIKTLERRCVRGDPRLFYPRIEVVHAPRSGMTATESFETGLQSLGALLGLRVPSEVAVALFETFD